MAAAVAIFVVILFILIKAFSNPAARYDRLQSRGLRGRALVLSANQITTSVRIGTRRFVNRPMTLEIELPGVEPYEITGTFAIPRGFADPVPGASLDVAVDPRNRSTIAILGPGGFTGPWLQQGPPQPY